MGLSDQDADEIARGRANGVDRPLIKKWVDRLLADPKERVAQILRDLETG